jgi:hypothetical protein
MLVGVVIALAGCVGRGGGLRGHLRGGQSHAAPQAWPMPIVTEADVPLPAESAPRGTFAPDAVSLPTWDDVNKALGDKSQGRADGYLLLTPDVCADRAAEKAPVVELLRLERAAAEEVIARGYDREGKLAAQVQMLDLRIEDRRSRAAADALADLYQLADAQSQHAVALEILREIDEMVAAAEKIEKVTGNSVPERRDLAIRQTEARDDLAGLAAQIELLDGRLRTMLAIDASDERRIRPEIETEASAEGVDVEQATALALERRVEIRTLRLTDDTVALDTLATTRTLLAKEDGGLGTVATPDQALRTSVGKYELGVRRMQLAAATEGTERRIAAEVRAAALAVETALRHVARANEVRAQRHEARRLMELEARFERATRFELGTTNIEALRADAQLRHEIVELRQAEIRLLTATGTLLD